MILTAALTIWQSLYNGLDRPGKGHHENKISVCSSPNYLTTHLTVY